MAKVDPENNLPSPKKLKLDNEIDHLNGVTHCFKDLSEFKPVKILSNNSTRKTVCVQGAFEGREGVALILLEKKAFVDDEVTNNDYYFTNETLLKYLFKNDIYSNCECFPNSVLSGLKTTIIFPATDKHIQKYSSQTVHLIDETPDSYNNVTKPHIESEQFSLQWVYNILDHKSETDRIVFEDPDPEIGFVLLPDLKWDGKTTETLYLIAIVRQRSVKSLRDLNDAHLPLLKNILIKGTKAIEEKYKLPASQLRIYLHYQPSFYHLHVHFTYLKHEAPGIFAEKSHILSNVISNIELLPHYYQKVTLPFVIREKDSLFDKYIEHKLVERLGTVPS